MARRSDNLRCAIEQGEQIFAGLKTLGIDTKMIRFSDEPHGLSRASQLRRRVERLEHTPGWFERYVKKDEA